MAPSPPDSARDAWLSLPAVAGLVIGLTILKAVVAAKVGLSFDEGYYALWSQGLAVGYLDHPPAVAYMIALGRALLGDNELGVRLLALVFGLVLTGLIYRIGALLFDRRTALLAVFWYALTPVAGLGFITTPDPPSVLFWTAALWAVAEFMAARRPWWWLLAGVFAGLGLWSKYTDAFLGPGLLLFILASRERRRWLRLWQVWAGAALALVVFAPVIGWNAARGWISFTFQGQRAVADGIASSVLSNFGDLFAGQALYLAPILFAFALWGIVSFLRQPGAADRQGLALPVLTALPALAYFLFHTLHGRVEANWLMPLGPTLALIAAAALTRLWARRPRLARLAVLAQALTGVVLVALVYGQALYQPMAFGIADRTNETRGWPELVKTIETLAHDHGAHWIATSGSYAVTGELATYALFDRAALTVRQVDESERWEFLPPFDPDQAGWPALYVAIEPNPAQPAPPVALFGEAKLLTLFQRQSPRGPLETWSAYLVSAPTPALYAGLKR